MIKVEVVRSEGGDTAVLHFESRTTDPDSLDELDSLYEVLMKAMTRTVVKAGYDNSNRFSIELGYK